MRIDLKPVGVVLVTDAGLRIPADLKFSHTDDQGIDFWEPIVEADPHKLWPSVHHIAAESVPYGTALAVPSGPGYDTAEWGQRVFMNSDCFGKYVPGEFE